MLNSIFSIRPRQIKEDLANEFPAYRYKQLMKWLYEKFVFDPDQMTNLPADLKQYLAEHYDFCLPKIVDAVTAADETTKYALSLTDGSIIEMVLIPDGNKRTLCVSSQVGCSRACSFCATGRMGLKRNLFIHEIVAQILLASQISAPHRLTNLVFMGMGEPLDNLDNLISCLQIIQDDDGLSFSPRRTTISTCGVTQGIIRLADSGVKAKLAVSLNSAIDEKRNILMPINQKEPLPRLKQAILYYLRKSSFRVTFEYILIPDFNMDSADIKALKRFVGDLSCKLNFIPYNEVPDLPYRSPTEPEIENFLRAAKSINQAITLRRSRGAEVCGACGQLSASHNHQIKANTLKE
jgi:23S rRNA (adenine2503-C2)-methyltransferase